MNIKYDRFYGGKSKALTLSYDDGREQDRRLVELMNRYGLKGAFHLNSGLLGRPGYIHSEEIQSLYQGHEVSVHTASHPFLDLIPQERLIMEIMEDRSALEELVGHPVRGMSYPFGSYNEQVVQLLSALGMDYARTTGGNGGFSLPSNPLLWNPTCHHKQMLEYGEKFILYEPRHSRMSLLYIWGHSYEYDRDDNWELVEQFGELAGGRADIWYATNIEIIAYLHALQQLQCSVSGRIIHNPSATAVWASVEGEAFVIPGGQTVHL
ncbi:polysaccharide deacetylase family protein [Paenibacillus sp. FSL H8-0034]|uniref:polysaccharide deacetylase family protein n=1 Tax=Paenibacillus sp. FSL H8-0034 TaxID=2954671 RepID=UPI0030F844C6